MVASRLAIVGAGPAGLVAALAARRLGLELLVFEQAPAFERAGAAFLLHNNGLRVLDALGLLDALAPVLAPTDRIWIERTDGARLAVIDYQELPVPHNRAAIVLRADLQDALAGALERAGVAIRFGHRCQAVAVGDGRVRVEFTNGAVEECDALIGADGVGSQVRAALGLPGTVRHISEAYLRGVADVRTDGPLVEVWHHDGRRFGRAPLPGGRTYFYCSAPLDGWRETLAAGLDAWVESWEPFGPRALEVLRAVTDWERVHHDALREVRLRRWCQPPVFLIGDAAHAMTPNLGQGANSAMVDALVLVRLLAPALREGGDLEAVTRTYERLRRPFVTQIQQQSRLVGQLAGWRTGPLRLVRDAAMRLAGRVSPLRRRQGLVAAGYQRSEEPYLAPLGGG